MEQYKIDNLELITDELILALIERYKTNEVPRLHKLQQYYLGNTAIKNRKMTDASKPNNKISNPFASMITETVIGYFLGYPIAYKSEDEDLMLKLQDIYNENHERSHNNKMGKQLSIKGIAYELIYIDEEKKVKFNQLDAENVFIIYDNSINPKPLMAVRFFDIKDYVNDSFITKIETYTEDTITNYVVDGESLILESEPVAHYFKGVPVIRYANNDELMGDYEKVMDLIDAYDLAISNTSNDLSYFSDSYLVLSGMENTEPEDISEMKENRVMLLGENGKAEWLIKSQQNVEIEEFKNRLKDDIHNFSFVPDLGSDSFGTATSGESLKYKLFGLENAISIKERHMTESLEDRIELITTILNIKGANHVHTDVKMNFTRNIPTNMTAIADSISKLIGVVSHETILSILPFIDDPASELAKIKHESEDSMYADTFAENAVEAPIEEV
ncbi:MAG: phage portal protein [Carnobacterium sp.]|uniref:phage portal protein n=1 Tax=Carnobacterium sp. TaxID=48221 RepID=UPI003C7497A8